MISEDMNLLLSIFCGTECQTGAGRTCSSGIMAILDPSSCANHILVISANCFFILVILITAFFREAPSKRTLSASERKNISHLSICSLIFNTGVALGYFAFGIWSFGKSPPHAWLVLIVHGLTWLLICLSVWKQKQYASIISWPKLCGFAAFLAGVLCVISMREIIITEVVSIAELLDISSFPGGVLLFLCAIKAKRSPESDQDKHGDEHYVPLEGEEMNIGTTMSSKNNITPFAEAGFLSKISFSWLNELMKKGKEKTLEDQDIPELRKQDRAETCYFLFKEEMRRQEQHKSGNQASILSSIIFCQWKAILISGFFALVKIITLSSGPIFLYAFIGVAQGRRSFEYAGYALTGGLFLAKCIESLAERQWYFRTRMIGLQIQSLLTAAIYNKQLCLSSIAKSTHSPGEIMNYVTVDAYRIGEFPYWLHQIWTTSLQICLALAIIYYAVGLATLPALGIVILSMLGNYPVAKLQYRYLTALMVVQDKMLKAVTEALMNIKVLKFYAWETHFKNSIALLRLEESKWISKVLAQKGYYVVLFWSSPVVVSAVTFWACYLLNVPLSTSNVFTFLATLRIVQEPIRSIPDVLGVCIEAKVSFSRIIKFLQAPELHNSHIKENCQSIRFDCSVLINCKKISWDVTSLVPTLSNISLLVKPGEKVAICGEVGSGKSTLLGAILGEIPLVDGNVEVQGKIAYVSQTAWVQTGTIQQNILFGSIMDEHKYQEVIRRCSLVKDLDLLPFGDQTVIGERGVNLSGGQKQRVQLARALYKEADIYLLDDPFSAVDAHTARSLFNEYVLGALSGKTVLLVTHQVDFLPAFESILLMSDGKILRRATYDQMHVSCQEFSDLVHAHGEAAKCEINTEHHGSQEKLENLRDSIQEIISENKMAAPPGEQLIKQEERETGSYSLRPYMQYLRKNKGFFYLSLAILSHLVYVVGQLVQNAWLATNLEKSSISELNLLAVYSGIGCTMALSLLSRSYAVVILGLKASKTIFAEFMSSIFRAPMSFYDSTPLGRILSRVSSDLSIVDLDLSFKFSQALSTTMTTYFSLGILAALTWPILIVIIPMVFVTIFLQKLYFASAKELIRIHGTTKSSVASYLSESIAGAMTIRAFKEKDRFFTGSLQLIDKNASAFFHTFSANEWLIQRLEVLCAIILSSSALALTFLPLGASGSGYIGMALSYALSLNVFLAFCVQNQCMLENSIVSVERLEQYMYIPSEAPEVIEGNRPPLSWPHNGRIEIQDLKVRYQPSSPLVLHAISCTFEGGFKVGIVGRTGSGKTTLISTLFRLVEPTEGAILIDGLDISTIGIHDLRSHLAIIPQEPTLFLGSIRYNLDPLSEHSDHEIWEVLEKCQLQDVVEKKEERLDSLVTQDGSNWSMGQRQLLCLGRALLKRRKILILDEATASIDNATDSLIQKTIRREFADCTVITVAHRIPTVMDCTMVLALADGKMVEYDNPKKLIKSESSLFGRLVKEYWLQACNPNN